MKDLALSTGKLALSSLRLPEVGVLVSILVDGVSEDASDRLKKNDIIRIKAGDNEAWFSVDVIGATTVDGTIYTVKMLAGPPGTILPKGSVIANYGQFGGGFITLHQPPPSRLPGDSC